MATTHHLRSATRMATTVKPAQPALFADPLEHCPICGHDPCATWLSIHRDLRQWIIDNPREKAA